MNKRVLLPRFGRWKTLLMMLAGLLLIGCAAERWSPTDPRLEVPAADQLTIDDSWQITVGTDVNASAWSAHRLKK